MTHSQETGSPVHVSVLMPVHNTSAYVDEACRSILQQSVHDLELVVIDDGSTDDSPRRLQTIAAQDQRVKLLVRENRGLIATRNELLSRARASLVTWMDSDDRSPSDRLAKQIARFEEEPGLVCLGGAILEVDPEGEPIQRVEYPCTHAAILEGAPLGSLMTFGATMMRRQAVLDVGGFREPFLMGEDFDLMLRLSEVGGLATLRDVLLHYRRHESNTSRQLSSRWPVYRDAALALARERRDSGRDRLQRGEQLTLSLPPDPPLPEPGIQQWRTHWWWARLALSSGYPATARKHSRRALQIAPWKLASWKLAARVQLTGLLSSWQ